MTDIQKPKLFFSYQGAFGPPTYGHYKSMEIFANTLNEKYEAYDIIMYFMPTPSSNSKKHLEPTWESRIKVLNIFCQKLKEKFPNIIFQASKIEKELKAQGVNTGSTINTIIKIRETMNDSDILIIGMGLDNLLQLPFWEGLEHWKINVNEIYAVDRDLGPTNFDEFKLVGQDGNFMFDMTAPWTLKKEIINDRFVLKEELKNDILKGENILDYLGGERQLKIEIPNMIVLSELIPGTSSSMMRYFISELKNLEMKIAKLMFGPDWNENIQVVKENIEEYKMLFSNEIISAKGGPELYSEYDALELIGGRKYKISYII